MVNEQGTGPQPEEPKASEQPKEEAQQGQAEPSEGAQQGAEAESASASETDVATLQKKLEDAEAKLSQSQEEMMRVQAEAQNARKRAEKDVSNARKYGLEKFANELLPVMDSLERAVDAAETEEGATQAMKEGVSLTLKQFQDALQKFNIESIEPQGEAFNPEAHEAMSMLPSEDAEPNTVVQVLQKGYWLNDRLLRPAMVIVAKPPEGGASGVDEQA